MNLLRNRFHAVLQDLSSGTPPNCRNVACAAATAVEQHADARDVICFDTEPVKVNLENGPYAGIECQGQYGIDWRYSVNDGKAVMCLPEEARDALVQSGVSGGEEVAIRRLGKRRWEVERMNPTPPLPKRTRRDRR